MRVDLITIFPEYFSPLKLSLFGKAQEAGLVEVEIHDLRFFTIDKHKTVDDAPYGGGPGMVMSPVAWGEAIEAVLKQAKTKPVLVVPTPSGKVFNQEMALQLASYDHLVFINGRYEGIDSRVVEHYQQSGQFSDVIEVSIGDYVLAGGEVAALVILEATSRLINGVIGNEDSVTNDSFAPGEMHNLLEGPIYTRPPSWQGLDVPEVLLSGDHAKIAQWRKDEALKRTRKFRPELQA
ncbi:MAG: tRNA (guanosine(37)-N1)-methyltransferase TrmD [Candidatus Nanopelagicales bacterium]|nr:tRNA (guanosine(37)-N1)-methyltransferase TrmD [Candidatus Nanopelagicales bacterium]